MGLLCIFCGQQETKDNRSFHKFPSDPGQCEVWFRNMGLDREDLNVVKVMRLCSDHFEKKCFASSNDRSRLLPGSVPTKFGRYYLKCTSCSNVKKRGSSISFHRFPMKNPALLQKWLQAVGQKNFYPTEKNLLCDQHFEKKCFHSKREGSIGLRANSFPTIFTINTRADTNTTPFNNVTNCIHSENQSDYLENGNNSSLPMTDHKRLCLRRLSDSKHLKLSEVQHDQHIDPIDENGSLDKTDDTTGEETAPTTATTHSVENNIFLPICFFFCLVMWIYSFMRPCFGENTAKSHIDLVENENELPNTARRIQILQHDHHYAPTPKILEKQFQRVKRKLKVFSKVSKAQKQHIRRLQQKVSTLTEMLRQIASHQQSEDLRESSNHTDDDFL